MKDQMIYEAKYSENIGTQFRIFNTGNISYHIWLSMNENLDPKIQHKLFKLSNLHVHYSLLGNTNLIPELFSQLFILYKQHMENIQYLPSFFKHQKYKNSQTQYLLEKAIFLS